MNTCKTRSLFFRVLPVVLLALWALLPAIAHTGQKDMKAPPSFRGIKPGDFMPSQIVVFAKTEGARKDILKLARSVGAEILHENTPFKMFLFSFLSDPDAEEALKKINKKYLGLYSASRNWKFGIPPIPASPRETQGDRVSPQHITNDPGFKASWWLQRIKEPYAGTPLAGDKNIAIIDSGVDYTHSELEGKVAGGFDYVDWDADVMDENGHGTHCAGIAAAKANNASGIHGVSPNSKIYAYRVFNRQGEGGWYQIAAAIIAAADNPNVKILSLSLGGFMIEGSSDYLALQNIINYARTTKGKIVCVAAGNDSNIPMYYYLYYGTQYRPVPAYFPQSFTVAASDCFNSRADFSNYDVNTTSGDGTVTYNIGFVDIIAPGYDIRSTYPGELYASMSGTSQAAPMVAGACARVWGKNPGFTAAQVESKLINSGKYVGEGIGWPVAETRIDLMKALGVSKTGFQGIVRHSESGYPVYNVKVEARLGSASGTLVTTAYTDKAGVFTLTGLTGGKTYYLKMSKTGFVGMNVVGGTARAGFIMDINPPFFLVPNRAETAADQNWRIVAAWKNTQPGYDDWNYGFNLGNSQTWYPFKFYQSAGFETNAYLGAPDSYIYGNANPGALGVYPYVAYVYDSIYGSPLECHVIQKQMTGLYRYVLSAHPQDKCWGTINFGAGGTVYPNRPAVKIYRGNILKATIESATSIQDGTGTLFWHVFDLDTSSGTITVVNKITDTWPFL